MRLFPDLRYEGWAFVNFFVKHLKNGKDLRRVVWQEFLYSMSS